MPAENFMAVLTENLAIEKNEWDRLENEYKAWLLKTADENPGLVSVLNEIFNKSKGRHGVRLWYLFLKSQRQQLPHPLRAELEEMLTTMSACDERLTNIEKLLVAARNYSTKRQDIENLLREDRFLAETVKSAVNQAMTYTDSVDFSFEHERILTEIYSFLRNTDYQLSKYKYRSDWHNEFIDSFPGGRKLGAFSILGLMAQISALLLALCMLVVAVGGSFHASVVGACLLSLWPIFMLGLLMYGLVQLLSSRTGMAKVMEDFLPAVVAMRAEQAFNTSLEKFSAYKSNEYMEAAVTVVIQEVDVLKQQKLASQQSTDDLTLLLTQLITLMETGTEFSVDAFMRKYQTMSVSLRRCTGFFMPSGQYRLDQAVNSFALTLKDSQLVQDHLAQEMESFEQALRV